MKKQLVICFLCLWGLIGHSAEIYKWVDNHGRVHYSQVPPEGEAGRVEKLEKSSKSSSINISPSSNQVGEYSKYLESERLEREQQKEQEKQELAELREKCDRWRKRLNDYQNGGVIYYELNEQGERVYWSDKRLNEEREKLTKTINTKCGGV